MSFPIGHSLVSLTIAKKTNIHPLPAIMLANISDIDYFFGLFFAGGDMNALHQTIYTHSPIFALALSALVWIWARLRGKAIASKTLAGVFFILLSHMILDFYVRLPYRLEIGGGTEGFWDFMYTFVINPDFIYNNLLDLAIYGTLYVIVVKLIFKEKRLF